MRPALHIPDGFIDVPTSAAVWVIAVLGIALALRGARRQLDDSLIPMAGLTAVFIFAMQMLNFPVAAGTSGHLIGAALAAVLIGPWAAVLALTVVLVVQALFFADGGLIALGLNITNLALVAVAVSWLVFSLLARLLPKSPLSVIITAGIAGFLSVPVAALAFVVEFALGGTGAVPLATVFTAMVGVHLVIGVIEGIVTALVVAAVLALRPDLVFGARGLLPERMLTLTPARAPKGV
ncbi:MAG: energy-coupling factor ABC transporter permease [Actinomycetales bacterium]|nr:energy-coupling factor ABC transporter permease [Actinomycetales bacterium]